MKSLHRALPISLLLLLISMQASAAEPTAEEWDTLAETWSEAQTAPLLDKTLHLRLPYTRDALEEAERKAVRELLAAGERMHLLYLDQRHPQALLARRQLAGLAGRNDLKDLFRLMKGPIATTLDNRRQAFLSVDAESPGSNVYPPNLVPGELDAWLAENPQQRSAILNLRTIVRRATPEVIGRVLQTLDRHPTLDVLHPGLRERTRSASGYLAIPYSVAWAPDIFFIYEKLNNAAALLEKGDPAFARYLRLRARDLLSDDYEGGDAAWVTGKFTGNLNAEIGSYETYDDGFYGVKSFFAMSLLQRDSARSDELNAAIGDIQGIENALPYDHHKTVRSDIPVGVYNIIADFGQSRGTNTATILPNEAHLARQYGRTILIRASILLNPELFNTKQTAFKAATHPDFHDDLTPEGGFYRTLWHEIGHYLGVDRAGDGRDLSLALQDSADLLEEMKADLVSLTAAGILHGRGQHSNARLRAIRADGILRVLQKNKPRRTQPYSTMQLIQWNWFMEQGLLALDQGRLRIHYDNYPRAVSTLLAKVLELQYQGSRAKANAFVDTWTHWDDNLHGAIAQRMRDAERYRYRLVRYEALGE